MNTLFHFIKKEIFHITRDFRTLSVLFGLPIVQLILFGYAIRTEINDSEIGIIDYSKDNVTKEIIDKVLSSKYFKVKAYLYNDKQVEDAFKAGLVKEVIVFEVNFAKRLEKDGKANIQIITDASNPNVATLLKSYTSSIVRNYQTSINQKTNTNNSIILSEIKLLYNPEMKSVLMFVPGLIAFIMMLVSAMMTSIAITKEKEMGTMEVLLVSPLKPQIIIIGKVIPYIVLAFINSLTILFLARVVFEIPFQGNLALFLGETILYIMTSLSLGILISTFAKTQQVAMMVALAGLLLPTTLLSGFIFPVENMPKFLQIISYILPAKWFLTIVKGIMLKGLGFDHIWFETLVLFCMMLFNLLISVRKFKIRLE